MNIKQKLYLSNRPDYITLFKEGMFLRAYGVSAYILVEFLGNNLNITVKDGIASCGFRRHLLDKMLPNCQSTGYGYELKGCFYVLEYKKWLHKHSSLPTAVTLPE